MEGGSANCRNGEWSQDANCDGKYYPDTLQELGMGS